MMLSRLSPVFAALPLLLACLLSARADPTQPNVLVIFIDDMGYADPSCFGNPLIETPNIDRLAEEGTKLTNFYANSPICSASCDCAPTSGRQACA